MPAAYMHQGWAMVRSQFALARDTMRGPGERACHKSKPMHHTKLTRPFCGVALGPEATMSPARQSSQQQGSPDGFRVRGFSLQPQSTTWPRWAPQRVLEPRPRLHGRTPPHRPSNPPQATATGRAQRPSRRYARSSPPANSCRQK